MTSSILTLSDTDLQAQFWKDRKYNQLRENAALYKDEIETLFKNTQWMKLRPILSKLFQVECHLHKWNICRAFGDTKWAVIQYKQIKYWEEWYDRAQYNLFNLYVTEGEITESITHLNNIDTDSPYYQKGCTRISKILSLKWKYQEFLEWILKTKANDTEAEELLENRIIDLTKSIKKISLWEWKMDFIKWKKYKLIHLHLDNIHHLKWHRNRDSAEETYIVSLSHNDSTQDGRCNFLCNSFVDIERGWDNGRCVELEELDYLIHDEKSNI